MVFRFDMLAVLMCEEGYVDSRAVGREKVRRVLDGDIKFRTRFPSSIVVGSSLCAAQQSVRHGQSQKAKARKVHLYCLRSNPRHVTGAT